MNKYAICFFFVVLFLIPTGGQKSLTTFTIRPHIGEYMVEVTQDYYITQEKITEFEILTISLSYADLKIFDEKGSLDFKIGGNIIFGRNVYRKITVFFREQLQGPYSFTVQYWFPTSATGKPLTGKYKFTMVNITDSTFLNFEIPLTDIMLTSRASAASAVEEKQEMTFFSYQFSKDTTVILAYESKEGIDYKNTATETLSHEIYDFEVEYPVGTEIFLDDIASYVADAFPFFLSVTGTPLRFSHVDIELTRLEDTWAAAEYAGNGDIRIFLNNTASYPSQFLSHELTHSYIGDFPRYLEEGLANYFEAHVARHFAPSLPETYIPNKEPFFITYENQFGKEVDITSSRYGLGVTEHQEALIYAKYSKGSWAIQEIAAVCGHETVQEMLAILNEQRNCDLNCLVSQLSKGDIVYAILRKYGFDIVPPHAYPAEEVLQEVKDESWWSQVLCIFSGFSSKIREASVEEIPQLTADIESKGKIASDTLLLANGILVGLLAVCGTIVVRRVHRAQKKNPKVLAYFYLVPVAGSCLFFSYLLYEFLFNGYKLRWILANALAPWGAGILSGMAVLVVTIKIVSYMGRTRMVVDVIWSFFFFAIAVVATRVFMLWGILLVLGYVASLLLLFVRRRK